MSLPAAGRRARYVLAPKAAFDLFEICQFIEEHSSLATADHVESVIREKFVFLASSPEAGHRRSNLTEHDVKFFPVYSYLIVRPANQPATSRSILHGRRDVEQILKDRL